MFNSRGGGRECWLFYTTVVEILLEQGKFQRQLLRPECLLLTLDSYGFVLFFERMPLLGRCSATTNILFILLISQR